ncbi:15695_t:CDS:1, partial [Funneliformis mosseae]
MEVTKFPSKLFVRTAMRIEKVKLNRLTERLYMITSKKVLMMGEKLEREILSLCSEIQQNISQLENPSSYENYFEALPKIICDFFQALIT